VTITLSVVLRTEGGVAMLRAVIISPSRSLADELQPVLASLPIAVVRVVEHYPTENELLRLLRSLTPQLILLSVERDRDPRTRRARGRGGPALRPGSPSGDDAGGGAGIPSIAV
jgi:hypothetical protein